MMAKDKIADPRGDARAELDKAESDRDKLIPAAMRTVEAAEAKFVKARIEYDAASKELVRARRSYQGLRYQLDTRETVARSILAATADPRIAEFIDEVQYSISTRRNEFFGATSEGMQRWQLAIQRCCDEARALQCSPADDGKVTAFLATWRATIEAAEKRIAERSGEPVSIGEELSKAVRGAEPFQRTKGKHGQRYQELE